MDGAESLLTRLQELDSRVWVAGPQSEQAILQLEQAIGVPMPPSYRQFLARFGGFSLLNSSVSGIIGDEPLARGTGRLVWDTNRFRRQYGLPPYLLVVQPDEDAPYCLDANRRSPDGELPVVCYELYSGHVSRLASSFGEWFAGYLQSRVDAVAEQSAGEDGPRE